MSKFKGEEAVQKVLDIAKSKGIKEVEAFYVRYEDLEVEATQSKIETLKISEEEGLGVRLIDDQRLGFSYTTDFEVQGLEEAIENAFNAALLTKEDEYLLLPVPSATYPQPNTLDPTLKEIPLSTKIEMALKMEREAKAFDKRIKLVESSSYTDTFYEVALASSKGMNLKRQGSYCGLSIAVVAADEEESQTGFDIFYSTHYEDLDPVKVGIKGASNALKLLGGKRVNTKKTAIILSPYVASEFLSLLGASFLAENVQKKKSILAGREGEKVFSSGINIIDNAILDKGVASASFDGEGVPTRRNILVEDGRIASFLHNTYTANKAGLSSTGNARRDSYKATPEVGFTNFYLAPGDRKEEELLQDTEEGFYIMEVMGMHTANPISGDFSVGASGLWLKKGEVVYPVHGVAIAGNIFEIFAMIEGIGDNLTFYGSIGSPTLKIKEMMVSGE